MDEPDYEIAVLATMSEAIRGLTVASGKTENEQLQTLATTAASICLSMMLKTQRQPAKVHAMDGGKLQ